MAQCADPREPTTCVLELIDRYMCLCVCVCCIARARQSVPSTAFCTKGFPVWAHRPASARCSALPATCAPWRSASQTCRHYLFPETTRLPMTKRKSQLNTQPITTHRFADKSAAFWRRNTRYFLNPLTAHHLAHKTRPVSILAPSKRVPASRNGVRLVRPPDPAPHLLHEIR